MGCRSETVTATWLGEQSFLLKDHQGFPILMAQPEGVLGADLLPLSLIGCAGWDVMSILRKQKQPVLRCEVEAESERDDEPPWRFRRIRDPLQDLGAWCRARGGGAGDSSDRREVLLGVCHIESRCRDLVSSSHEDPLGRG